MARRGDSDERLKDKLMDVLRHDLPARVPEPHRRDRHLPLARQGRDRSASSTSSSSDLQEAPRRAQAHARADATRRKALLAERGYDPVFGARPLKRTIQRMIENPLAVEVLAGRFRDGDHVIVDTKDRETFNFRKEAPVSQPA